MGVGERVGGGISTPVPSVIGHWGKEDTKLPNFWIPFTCRQESLFRTVRGEL